MSRKEGSGVQPRQWFSKSPNFSPTIQPPDSSRGWGLPFADTVAFGPVRPVAEGTENRVCPVSGGGEEGPMVHGRYLVAALPRAPFLAKSILMGKQWRRPQVVNWEGREARKLSVLSAPVSKILPTSPPATWHINPSRALSTVLLRRRDP